VGQYLGLYLIILMMAVVAEWAAAQYGATALPEYYGEAPRGFLKDVGSYLLAAQIGILAIVSVAIGVVTLLSQRDDGASANTDVRLYYVESYSYELTVSGVALLLILAVQLYWPLQHVLHAVGLGNRNYVFKLVLSSLHVLWFCLNLGLFLQFITTTLRFVEPNSREALRERYSANEIIPRDAKKRLLRAFYMGGPSQVFGEQTLKDGPTIYFGYPATIDESVKPEVTRTVQSPVRLRDVRMRPLVWVLKRWQKRVRSRPQRDAKFGRSLWDDYIAIVPNFEIEYDGSCDLVRLRSEVGLTRLEKWVVRRCFVFAASPTRDDDLPAPENFLKQLIDKVVKQTEASSTTGFDAALDEVVRYHRFVLGAQNTTDNTGAPLNLAEIGGYFSRPDANWIREYRRVFAIAADKIGSDTYFVDRLSHLAELLVPEDGLHFSQRVIQTVLELGVHEVISLEDWLTKRAVVGPAVEGIGVSTTLTGSDSRAYEKVLIELVGAWERLAHTLIFSFGVKRRPSDNHSAAQWTAFAKGFPVFQTHLQYAAYFLVAAVWNDDVQGTEWFRDLLLRWPQPFYAILQSAYFFKAPLVLLPDLTRQDWLEVQTAVSARMTFPQGEPAPGPVSGIILWELHCDVICVVGLVSLFWYVSQQQPSATAARAAVSTLRREKREDSGSDLIAMPRKSEFRLLFDFAIRYALNPRFAGSRYSATIDELVQSLTRLASPRMVSGRVYGGYGIGGFETLSVMLLAALAANLPEQGDDGVGELVEVLSSDPLFDDDKAMRTFVWSIQQLVQTLDTAAPDDAYAKAIGVFGRQLDIPSATARLRGILAGIVAAFEELRKERLRNAPLDEERIALVRRRMSAAVMAHGPMISCFTNYPIHRDRSGTIPVQEAETGVIDRGMFVTPEMSEADFDDLPDFLVRAIRMSLSNLVWQELYHRPKRVIPVDISASTDEFWQRVVQEAPTVGAEPIILVPYPRVGDQVTSATIGGRELAGLTVSRIAGTPSGEGTGYLGTIQGVHIYSLPVLSTQALLCSRLLLREIEYGVVHDPDDIVGFEFLQADDPRSSQVRLPFAQRLTWGDESIVEFSLVTDSDA